MPEQETRTPAPTPTPTPTSTPTPTPTPTPNPTPPEAARLRRVAVFYSISSPFDGLRGVPLGRLLIKRVGEELER